MCYDITEVIYMKKILFASNNLGKLNELKEIFKDYEVISPKDVGLNLDVLEDGETFLDNASKKAVEFYNAAILKDTEIAGYCGRFRIMYSCIKQLAWCIYPSNY